jgi:hypothetical protein
MIKNFLYLYKPIQSVITISDSKVFKNKDILLTNQEIDYLNNCLTILSIFVKATTKLQAEKYPTAYYIIPELYLIYNKLEKAKDTFKNVSNILIFIYLLILIKYRTRL